MVSFNYPPAGWALCNGQTLPINQNQALYSLLGTRFGGNGVSTFNLPDLRGRVPLHMGPGFPLGQMAGEEAHALTQVEMPQHVHQAVASTALATSASPEKALPGKKGRLGRDVFAAPGNLTTLHPASVSTAGASQPHQNMQPFLALNFAIALVGIYPTRN
ncbi:MAG TPA: phage tail protein [Massilia sp.]|nr:phage tail protein [Massilia sp.]